MGIFVFKGKYDFLDMYYPCPIKLDGVQYYTAMSAFAASRLRSIKFREDCATNEDKEYFKYLITNLRNSNLNSLMVPNFNEYDSLYKILKIKFSYKDLEERLKSTKDEKIIYLSKSDLVLGSTKDRGVNLLGVICMKIRDEIKD